MEHNSRSLVKLHSDIWFEFSGLSWNLRNIGQSEMFLCYPITNLLRISNNSLGFSELSWFGDISIRNQFDLRLSVRPAPTHA